MPVASEFDLLCEECGYRLEGLPADGACPECGRAIAESLPGRRRGTPAQRSASPRALGQTVWLAVRSIRSPRVLWDAARVGDAANGRIRWSLLSGASALIGAHMLLVLIRQWEWEEVALPGVWSWLPIVALILGIFAPFVVFVAVLLLALLTRLERWGIQFFGRMHGRRITPAVATTIVSHASAGWLVGAALLAPAWMVGRGLAAAADDVAILRWELVYMLPVILPALAGLLGLLLFEMITWQGVMRLRYANRARPGGESRGAEAA